MGAIANFVDKVGTGSGMRELGLSEFLNGGQRTQNTGITPQSKAAGFKYNAANPTSINGLAYTPPNSGTKYAQNKGVLGAATNNQGGSYQQPQQNNQQQSSGGSSFDGDAQRRAEEEAINNMYGESYNYLDQAENAVRSDHPNALRAAEEAYRLSEGQAMSGKASTLGQVAQNETTATRRKEDALSAARRLYDETSRGASQRFGGASSAGAAASEIMGRELQRNFGTVKQGFQDTMQVIEQKKVEIEQSFQSNIQQLVYQKQQSIDTANRDFQNKLLQISSNRAQIGQAKAQARLDALTNLRNQVFAIDQQNRQFEQTLQLQREQANLQLQAYGAQVSGYGGQAQGATQQYVNNTPTNYQAQATAGGQTQPQTQNPQLMGMIRKDDEYGQQPYGGMMA